VLPVRNGQGRRRGLPDPDSDTSAAVGETGAARLVVLPARIFRDAA
jgi:hypothetical protein